MDEAIIELNITPNRRPTTCATCDHFAGSWILLDRPLWEFLVNGEYVPIIMSSA